jgi:serine/threonine protein kinase/ABC-type branched-subunit amino acid transport system substrate-binding protein
VLARVRYDSPLSPMTSSLEAGDGPTERRALWEVEAFGKYVLVQKLAEGGMAEIFLAKQTAEGFERNVVVKRMLANLSRQPEFVAMFLDEARLAARLAHPNIVPIYDVGRQDDFYFICMEYLAGEDLSAILRMVRGRRCEVPIAVALRIVIDAARGLHHAHELVDDDGRPLHLVHRDVSPANVFVTYGGQAKLLDFGIAKAESRVTSTTIGVVKGKYHYMAPEQGRAGLVDRRADVFSLGVTLYEALTLVRPFVRDMTEAVMSAAASGDCPPPRALRADVPAELERVVVRAMAVDPDARPATARELADALERAGVAPASEDQVGDWLRALSGDDRIATRTRIPSLASFSARLDGSPTGGFGAVAPRPGAGAPKRGVLAAAIALGLVAAAGIAGWRAHDRRAAAPPEGCATRFGPDGDGRILLGATLPLSAAGKSDDGQLQLLHALELALDEINQRDGVAGRAFALRVCDNAGDLGRLKAQARFLVEREGVPALITSWSAHTLVAAGITVPRGVLLMSADATSPEIAALPGARDGAPRLVWRTAPSDALEGRAIADLLLEAPLFATAKRIAILYQDDPYGQGLAGILASRLGRAREIHSFQYPLRGEIRPLVKRLNDAHPDLTVLIGYPLDETRILNEAANQPNLTRASGHRWFFSDGAKEPTLFAGLVRPEELDGAWGSEPADGAGDEAASFQARFAARFGRDPTDQSYAANRYDAMYLLALAAAHAVGRDGLGEVTGARLAEGLARLSSGPRFGLTPDQLTAAKAALQAGGTIDVAGASGALDFDAATGEAPAEFRLWRVSGTGFVRGPRITDLYSSHVER